MTMNETLPPILFFGTEQFSLPSLQALVEAGFPVIGVITKPDSKKGRGQRLQPPAVKVYAEQQAIPVWQPHKLSEIVPQLTALTQKGPIAGVLVSYGNIITPDILSLFTPGIINMHPSLLPRYRGPSPMEAALLNGDTQTGISLMLLDRRMDAGPIYAQKSLPLTGLETKPQLYDICADEGAQFLAQQLPAILRGELQPVPQNETEATYCSLLSKHDIPLRPDTHTAEELERKIRAHQGFPKTTATVLGQRIIILAATVAAEPSQNPSPLDIPCKNGTWLRITRLIAENGKQMDNESFLRGYAR